MKKIVAMIMVSMLVLSACSSGSGGDLVDESKPIVERASKVGMTAKENEEFGKNYSEVVMQLGKDYTAVIKLVEKKKEDFSKNQTSVEKIQEQVAAWKDEELTAEYQRCKDSLKQVTRLMLGFFADYKNEKDAKQKKALKKRFIADVAEGLRLASIYSQEGQLLFLEQTNGDGKKELAEALEQINKPDTSYSNSFDKQWTKCSHDGCKLEIAFSGDSSCCIEHSDFCMKCKKYISEKGDYCSDCKNEASKE